MNMSEDEDCDDLPPITVNRSANNSSTFAMPTAEELAEQRAREQECERQLELLRQRARDDEQAAVLRRSDSSGSEGELALAAAVTALSVQPGDAFDQPAAALWAALASSLPPHDELQWSAPAAQLQRAVLAVGATLAAERAAWPDGELLGAAALLTVAVLARESRCRRGAARGLQALLDERAAAPQVSVVSDAMLTWVAPARLRLRLSDALRSGGGGGADRAADTLSVAALLQLLRAPAQDGVNMERVARAASAWRTCDAHTCYLCVQLAGRLLAATDMGGAADTASGAADTASGAADTASGAADTASGAADTASGAADTAGAPRTMSEVRSLLLAHLAPPPASARDAHRPDRLKALVGASKLKLLFRAKSGISGQPGVQRDTPT